MYTPAPPDMVRRYRRLLLKLDDGEVETVAHFYAAAFFDPEVDCILDIGGQDMKCIKIKNQTVDSVQLKKHVLPVVVLSLRHSQNH